MKNIRVIATICLVLNVITLFAQEANQKLLKVNVPFEFAVEDRVLPAGEYSVFTVTPQRSIRITSADGKLSAVVTTLPNYAGRPSTDSRLIFHRYGNSYFLVQVSTAAENVSRNLLSGRRAMEFAGKGALPQIVTIRVTSSGR